MTKLMAVLAVAMLATSAMASQTYDSKATNVYLQVDSFMALTNVPTDVTIHAATLVVGTPNYLSGSTPINYTVNANIGWALASSIVPDATNAGGSTGITPTVATPSEASGPATAGTDGNAVVSCTVPLTHAPISEGSKIQVGVVTLTLSDGL